MPIMKTMQTMISKNFEQLRTALPQCADMAAYAEHYVFSDPESALVKLRNLTETLVSQIYLELKLPKPFRTTFNDLLINDSFTSVINEQLVLDKLHAIRKKGNDAAHGKQVSPQTALWILKEAWQISKWYVVSFEKQELGSTDFIEPIPTDSQKAEFKKLRKKTQEELALKEQLLKSALKELEASRDKEKALLAQIEAVELTPQTQQTIQQKTAHIKSALAFSEAETRQNMIDADLRDAGWLVGNNGQNTEQVTQEEELAGLPTQTGVGYADYVLWDDDGKPLAVVEAKKTSVAPDTGRHQAKAYASSLEQKYGQRPLIFYTNGPDIWLWDDAAGYPPRKVYGYYSKDSLQYQVTYKRTQKKALVTEVDIDKSIAGRPYQIESITRVAEHFEKKHTKALVVQATGTGKTRVAIALTKLLLDASWSKRVLFLCDRKELRKQARNAFNEYIQEPMHVVGMKKTEDLFKSRIVVSTYPGMMSKYEDLDIGFFDLIIADESHRSIYNTYKNIFDYFDALQIGLTATPVEMIARSTTHMFDCEYKSPTANYTLEQAIQEKFLTPFKVIEHSTQFIREGIKAEKLTEEQIAQLEDQGIDPNDLDFDAEQIDKLIYNKDTNRAIIKNLMEKGLRVDEGQTLGKSIVFARNIRHARILQECFDEMYPQYGGQFCQVIHSEIKNAEQLIDDFKGDGDNKQLTIAISVDMMDTGIDVPEILNLVFAKPVKSKVKFWQMIGRGTRLCEDLYGTGQHKKQFVIFDHWKNFEYHEVNTEDDEGTIQKSAGQLLFETRIQLAQTALKKAELDVFATIQQLIRADIQALDQRTIAVRDKWQEIQTVLAGETLNAFDPKTIHVLKTDIAPLMQWLDLRGKTKEVKWHKDCHKAQLETLANKPDMAPHREALMAQVMALPMSLNAVRAKAETIKVMQKDSFWDSATFTELEEARLDLQDIMQYQTKLEQPPVFIPKTIDVKENEGLYETGERKTNLKSVDASIYQQKVEAALEPLFANNAVLKKIRLGQPVTEQELETLNSLVHAQHPDIDLNTLKEFYPESAGNLQFILRTLVGLDGDAIDSLFNTFIQHSRLNANQLRFVDMLKQQIKLHGKIEMDMLFEQPFTQIHTEGLFGVFAEEQAMSLVELIKPYQTVVTAEATS
jgi:type I restriction enzyme R subunit